MAVAIEPWSEALAKAQSNLAPGEALILQRKLALLALGAAVRTPSGGARRISGVVLLTPVATGRARSSWNLSVGQLDTNVPPPTRRAAAGESNAASRFATRLQQRAVSASLPPGSTIWVTSSLVYMPILEFGGYPKQPKLGSWDSKLKRYVIRSAGGFSKQAPRGMVRITYDGLLAALNAGQV